MSTIVISPDGKVVAENKVTYSFHVRDNRTGEVRLYEMGCEWFDHTVWFLTEGNFGCDCNRGESFARAGGISEEALDAMSDDDNDPFPCGHERYSIIDAVLSDGRVIRIDEQ